MLASWNAALGNKAQLGILARPVTHANHWRSGFCVDLHPGKAVGHVAEPPCVDHPQSIRDMCHGCPQEQQRIGMRNLTHRQGADMLRFHQRIGLSV